MSLSQALRVDVDRALFTELAELELPTSETLLKHDLQRTESNLNEIVGYLQRVLSALDSVKDDSLEFMYEGRSEVYELHRNMDTIDTIVADLVVVFEQKISETGSDVFDAILQLLSEICEMSLSVKRQSLVLKKKADIACQYHELESSVLSSIEKEIETCLKCSYAIHETRLSSPVRKVPQFTLEDLTAKMKPNATMDSLRLPTFNEIDETLYSQFKELEGKLSPLNASLMFVPQTLDSFSVMALEVYPDAISALLDKYDAMKEKLVGLNGEVSRLRTELVDQRWHEIFSHLTSEVNQMVEDVEQELVRTRGQLSHVGSYKVEIIDETLEILKRAIAEGLVKHSSINHDKNSLVKRVYTVKDQVFQYEKSNSSRVSSTSSVDSGEYFSIQPNFVKRAEETPSRRVSMRLAGSTISASLNLKPSLIEHNPISPEKTPTPRPVLGETSKHNIQDTPGKEDDVLAYGMQRITLHKNAARKTTLPQTPMKGEEDNVFLTPALRSRYRRQSLIPVPTPERSATRPASRLQSRHASRLPVPTSPFVAPKFKTLRETKIPLACNTPKTRAATALEISRPPSSGSRIPLRTPVKNSIPVRSRSALAIARERSVQRIPSNEDYF